MIKIQRLTADSSWHVHWDGTDFLIDPWLTGSEIDGFAWLNEQWHTTDPVPVECIPNYDFILISQPYSDHCHTDTIALLDESKAILATPKACKKLKRKFPERKITSLQDDHSLKIKKLSINCFTPKKLLDPIYYAVLITNEQNQGIFYCPHGFSPGIHILEKMQKVNMVLLITTFITFELPAILGGKVNPGLENVKRLKEQLNPQVILNTHDENKVMKGLVAACAKVAYPDYRKLEASHGLNFKYIRGYAPVIID